ncbi:MAG TPA: anhydro-N-acetylmuramic acid kinase, partial [Rubrivivax sp.]|nr:anhydro-N-acetylmuramic acid kinase [Rubrivivax sp.]
MSDLFIGLMSGTSLDGVDGVLVRLAPASPPQVLAAFHADYPGHLREAVLGICAAQAAPLSLLGRVDVQIARLYADVVGQLLAQASLPADAVRGIGSHGQTVHHEPQGDTPFTMQLGDPNLLAARTGITVVADFRRRDMALGGQGAPLAPGFHEIVFRHPSRCRVVLNTGGIANISVLAPAQPCIGYDTGPANILMDAWMQSRHGVPFDEDGRLARQGAVDPPLLARLLADPYFALPPPKSTGREHFNIAWIEGHL